MMLKSVISNGVQMMELSSLVAKTVMLMKFQDQIQRKSTTVIPIIGMIVKLNHGQSN